MAAKCLFPILLFSLTAHCFVHRAENFTTNGPISEPEAVEMAALTLEATPSVIKEDGNEEELVLTCRLSSYDPDLLQPLSIDVFKQGQGACKRRIASTTFGRSVNQSVLDLNATVIGSTDDVTKPFLRLEWNKPTQDQSGQYLCQALLTKTDTDCDEAGHPVFLTQTLDVNYQALTPTQKIQKLRTKLKRIGEELEKCRQTEEEEKGLPACDCNPIVIQEKAYCLEQDSFVTGTYNEIVASCEDQGLEVVQFHDRAGMEALQSQFEELSWLIFAFYIGARSNSTDASYYLRNHQVKIEYGPNSDLWDPNEPQDPLQQNCVIMMRSTRRLRDTYCNTVFGGGCVQRCVIVGK